LWQFTLKNCGSQEHEQLVASLKSTQLAINDMRHKVSSAEAELDWMSFARDEAIGNKREELESRCWALVPRFEQCVLATGRV